MSWLVASTFADSNEIFAALTLRLSTRNIKFILKLHIFDLCHLLSYINFILPTTLIEKHFVRADESCINKKVSIIIKSINYTVYLIIGNYRSMKL